MPTATLISQGYARKKGVVTFQGRTYYEVNDVYNVSDFDTPSILGLPEPGDNFGDNTVVRFVELVKVTVPVVPMQAIYQVTHDTNYSYPAARRTSRLVQIDDVSLVVPHFEQRSMTVLGSSYYVYAPIITKRMQWLRVVERATGSLYSEAYILDFDATNAGKLYTFSGVNFQYKGTEALIDANGQVTTSARFITTARVKAYAHGTSPGWDVDLPALNPLDEYQVNFKANPPTVQAVVPSDRYEYGAAIPWI